NVVRRQQPENHGLGYLRRTRGDGVPSAFANAASRTPTPGQHRAPGGIVTSAPHPGPSPGRAGSRPGPRGPGRVDLPTEFAALATEPHPFALWERAEQLVDRFEQDQRERSG